MVNDIQIETQRINTENLDPSMRFDYPTQRSQRKQKSDILSHLKNTQKLAKKLSKNQKRLLVKPDHFVDLMTGDPQKKLHDQRNKARNHNKKILMNQHYVNYEITQDKEALQYSHSKFMV